jgi:hypothetical protein
MAITRYSLVALMILTVLNVLTVLNMLESIDGYIVPKVPKVPKVPSIHKTAKRVNTQALKLRNDNTGIITCNEKYLYMRYLIGVRNFRRVYRFITDNRYGDIQNIINILNILNTQISNGTSDDLCNNSIYIDSSLFHNGSLFINNTSVHNDKIAKNLILSNIYIDVSTIKYIQISTKNDTLVVELDKNNADIADISVSPNNIFDISKIETLVSSLSLLLKVLNIN